MTIMTAMVMMVVMMMMMMMTTILEFFVVLQPVALYPHNHNNVSNRLVMQRHQRIVWEAPLRSQQQVCLSCGWYSVAGH